MRRTLFSFLALLLLSGCAHLGAAPKAKFNKQSYEAIERVAVLNYRTLVLGEVLERCIDSRSNCTADEWNEDRRRIRENMFVKRLRLESRVVVPAAYEHLRVLLNDELGWKSPATEALNANDQYATIKRNYHENRSFSSKMLGTTTESDEAHPLAAIYWPLASIDDDGLGTHPAPVGHPVIQGVRGWTDNGLDDLAIRKDVMRALEVDALYQVRMTVEFPTKNNGPQAIKVWVQAHLSDGSQVEPIWRGKVIETKLSADEFNKDRIEDLLKHANTLIVEAQKQTAVAGFVDDVDF